MLEQDICFGTGAKTGKINDSLMSVNRCPDWNTKGMTTYSEDPTSCTERYSHLPCDGGIDVSCVHFLHLSFLSLYGYHCKDRCQFCPAKNCYQNEKSKKACCVCDWICMAGLHWLGLSEKRYFHLSTPIYPKVFHVVCLMRTNWVYINEIYSSIFKLEDKKNVSFLAWFFDNTIMQFIQRHVLTFTQDSLRVSVVKPLSLSEAQKCTSKIIALSFTVISFTSKKWSCSCLRSTVYTGVSAFCQVRQLMFNCLVL